MNDTQATKKNSTVEEVIIDASGKKIGRVASQAAALLSGKHTSSFQRNVVVSIRVTITNCSKADITEKKRKTTQYTSYSGFPGGFKVIEMDKVIAKKGHSEIFRKAVYGMLPINKLRSRRIQNLFVKE